jgi:hypothetical protein
MTKKEYEKNEDSKEKNLSPSIKTWTAREIKFGLDYIVPPHQSIEEQEMEFISKADLKKVLDEADNSTGFCGIGEREDPYDIRLFVDFMKELRRRLGLK